MTSKTLRSTMQELFNLLDSGDITSDSSKLGSHVSEVEYKGDTYLIFDETFIIKAISAAFGRTKNGKQRILNVSDGSGDRQLMVLKEDFEKNVSSVTSSIFFESSDYDVACLMRNIISEYDIEFPSLSDEFDVLSAVQYLLAAKSNGSIVDVNGTRLRISNVVHQEEGGRTFAFVTGQSYALYGDGVIMADCRCNIPLGNHITSPESMGIKELSKQEITKTAKSIKKKIRGFRSPCQRHVHGVGKFPGFMGSVRSINCNERAVFDPEGCSMVEIDTFTSLMAIVNFNININGKPTNQVVCDSDGGTSDTRSKRSVIDIESLTDDDIAITSTMAPAYLLDSKQWVIIDYDDSQEVDYRSDAMEKLILSSSRKSAIISIASCHNVDDGDIIDGKSSNSIFLLYGPPGTGKTLTAEAVAEYMEKPLYKVGMGEVGTDLRAMERSIKKVLELAERWDAILLIDESDVFLEARDSQSLERNAMVAVFLRLIEYYSGIMFLTTNRVSNFDDAVISRITMGIEYETPDNREVWKLLLENSKISLSDEEFEEVNRTSMNGRQIKTCINMAKSIAKYNNRGVTLNDLSFAIEENSKLYKSHRQPKAILNEN